MKSKGFDGAPTRASQGCNTGIKFKMENKLTNRAFNSKGVVPATEIATRFMMMVKKTEFFMRENLV